MNDIHHHHMNHALRLARQGLGRVWPNPSVGCVIVKDGRVVGLGRTQDGGRPHAERVALDMAGAAAKGATAYVTLEPCNLERPGGCCSQALIDAGMQEVHIGQIDPNAHTNGGGVERLRAAGIQVHTGLCKAEAEDVHKGFISRITQGRPFVTLKTATSADGRIATENGSSQWITGAQARAYAHSLRAGHDAVLAGIGTVLADDPLLTARLPGLDKKTVRVVLDSHLRINIGSKLVQSAGDEPVCIFHEYDKDNKKQQLEDGGCSIFSGTDIAGVLRVLAERGITRLLVEGGAGVHSSFLQAGLWDELHWLRAGKVIGGDGLACFGALGVSDINNVLEMRRVRGQVLGDDVVDVFVRKEG